jgi:hypothetical protein
MALLGLVPEEQPLPTTVKKRQTEVLSKINQTKILVPPGLPSTSKFLSELDEIANITTRNDR